MNQNSLTPVDSFKSVLNDRSLRNQVKSCMGDQSGNFLTSMLDLYSSDRTLQKCDPRAVAMECLKAASLKLPIEKGLGFAYVVPYGNRPTFVIGYKGWIQLAQRSGQYVAINADAIYEGEDIKQDRISGRFELTGTPTSDKAIGYFAYFKLVNGFEKMLYMSKEEVLAYARKYSKAYSSGPWQTEFDKMAKKTVLRQILKFGPMSTEMRQAETVEARSEEAQANETIRQEANKGPVIDIQVDEETGEVLSDPADEPAALPGELPDPGF